jgi:hypothetical protein
MASRHSHERPEKILVAMLELSNGATTFLKYEDIVVKAFKMFPDEFALRGHPEFPDSSDIHKPLYSVLKRKGLVRAAHKNFALTPRGVEVAQQLVEAAGEALHDERNANRMPRDMEAEVERMLKSDAYKLFVGGQSERVLDTDFYAFVGCTVRTNPNDFFGRLATTENAINMAKKLCRPDADSSRWLGGTWGFLCKRFDELIKRKAGKDGHRNKDRTPGKDRHPARAKQV